MNMRVAPGHMPRCPGRYAAGICVQAHCEEYPVKTICNVLGVTRSGYYAWLHNPIFNRAEEEARPPRLIRASFKASQGIYGSPRVFLDLGEAGETRFNNGPGY